MGLAVVCALAATLCRGEDFAVLEDAICGRIEFCKPDPYCRPLETLRVLCVSVVPSTDR